MEKYTKVRSIGEGAFGKALLVKDKGSGQQYVVKEIPMLRMKAKEREDARKEVSVLAQLHHPNIVRYRESFEEKGYLHIVMDFCEKGDLYHKISSQRGILFPEDQVMDWFVQISLAIKYVHDRKILHRDIKTQNIFLTSGGTIQLGDFGIAKVLGSTVELARTCIGTPYYLSPEICENRPYNNKSDVWSLGCVLYEMATLKHAFEAGNMKNLVLKIIRGSYPPLSPKYSYDLRGLIAKLFKRTPRDRPSVNSILKIPFVQRRVPKFLTDDQIADEFSHTIMHGHKLGNKIKIPTPSPASRPPSANRPPSAGVRRPLPPKPTPAVAPKKYNPANIYGTPVGRKSNDNRSSNDKRRPGSGSGSRPASSQQDLAKRKQDFMEKEKKRREEIQKAAMEKKHKDLMEKQKANRMNKAKEEGWKHVIGSLSSDDSDNREYSNDSNQAQNKKPVPRPAAQVPNNRGDYADYHAYLDKLDRDRNNRQNAPAGAAYMAAPRQQPIPNWNRAGVPRAPAATPIQQAEQNRQLGADAAERAKIVGDFIQRKKEAEMNKKRGNAELFGGAAPFESPRPGHTPSPMRDDGRPSSAEARNREEQEYLERLKKIRQANYMDRKNDKNSEADARKKKIEALRQQADDRAKQLREQLERQRRELFNKEERMRGQQVQRYGQGVNRPGSAPTPKPVPAVGMTGALKAIGSEPPQPEPVKSPPGIGMTGALKVIGSEPPQPEPVKSPPGIGMTGALKAIGAQNSPEETRPKSALQLKREEVLKGLNQRGPPRGAWGAPAEKPVIDIKEEEEEPESARSKWGEKLDDRLKELPLAETASAMEVTSARDQVIVNPGDVGADAASRRQWGRPGSTIMNALKEIPIMEGGSTMSSDKSDDSVPSSTASTEAEQKPGIGETITITKSSIHKGTITISSTENKAHVTRPEIELPAKPPISESESPEVNQSKSEPKITSSADEKTTQSKTSTEKEPEKSSSEGKLSKPPVANKPVFNKPPLPSKPVPAEKPLVLPKPTLLVKPDSPMSFAKQGQVPQEVNVMGEGSLFSRVELESEDTQEKPSNEAAKDNLVVEEIQDDISKDKDGKPHSGMAMALTTGHFDIRNTGLLRTCSEPDLSKLSKEDVTKEERRSLDLELNNENDIDDEVTPGASPTGVSPTGASPTGVSPTGASPTGVSPTGASPTEDKEQDKPEEQNTDNKEGEDDDEDIDEEEYEDLMSVRETMASLLIRECSTDDDNSNKVDTGKFRLSLASSCSREDNIEEENDGNDDKEDKTPDEEDENGDKVEEGDENGEKDDEDKVDENGENDELNNYAEALEEAEFQDDSSLFESDESDADTQFGDDEDNYDLFSRLEESRAELENEMGCDKFLKIYKTVQALQEDEDENIEEGARLAMNMLGKEYEHLYPKIFQLVMADAAFTEDNI